MRIKHVGYVVGALGILLLFVVIIAGIGNVNVPPKEFIQILLSQLPFVGKHMPTEGIIDTHVTIVMGLRMPRIVLSILSGFGFAYSGVIYQGVFRNPMAEPYLLGVSSGAALGATLASLFPVSIWFLGFSYTGICAFFGSMLVLVLIFRIGKRKGGARISVLLLSGLAINYFMSSTISLLMMFNKDKVADVYYWTMGSFRGAGWSKVIVVGIVVFVVILITYPMHKQLDLLLLGDEQAMSLGIDSERVKKTLLIAASLMTAVIVSACGIIGFVGLIIPHLVRILQGPKHKGLLGYSMLLGGIFLLLADTIARSVVPNMELSVGVITAIVGVPVFITLLVRGRGKSL